MPYDYPPATLMRRMAAAVYDGLLLIALWMAATFPLLALYHGEAVPTNSWWYPVYLLCISGGFHVWFWTHGGQTLGMRAWRLWAVNEQGNSVNTPMAVKRYILSVFAWISVIGVLWSLADPLGRTAHDLLSRSKIIHIPKV